jgi:hypothetical protein
LISAGRWWDSPDGIVQTTEAIRDSKVRNHVTLVEDGEEAMAPPPPGNQRIAKKVLEALALADLDNAAKFGDELIRIAEEAEWKALNTRQYEMWSDDFRQSTSAMVKTAKEKNLQGARLNCLGMTMCCFNCHSYVREQ